MLTVTVYLEGTLGKPVQHHEDQEVQIKVGQVVVKKTIRHTDRPTLECVKRINISSSVVQHWISNECPSWENAKKWKIMSKKQRIYSYVKGLDEGFGVDFEIVFMD